MISRKFIVSLAALSFSISVFAQGGFSYPGNFEFKPFTESTKAYNYSGVDVLLARNTSSNVDRHFTFLKMCLRCQIRVFKISKCPGSRYSKCQIRISENAQMPGTRVFQNAQNPGFSGNPGFQSFRIS